MIDERTKALIDALALQESNLSELYYSYSLHFANHDFWKELSVDENIHYNWVLSLFNSQEKVKVDTDEFRLEDVKELIDFVEQQKGKVKERNVIETLELALKIENTLVEKNCLAVFEGDSASFKHVLEQLNAATKAHIKEVEVELKRLKYGQN